ncbi:MAG: putative transposase [Paracoccaceae bacterium]|jgi:putative transposase
MAVLDPAEGGVPVAEPCREHDVMLLPGRLLRSERSERASFLKVWGKYRDMDASSINQMKTLKDENRRGADVNRPQHAG